MKRNTLKSNPRAAFSLLELLLSIAIIAILIALVSSAVMKVRMAALHVQSNNFLRQLALAYHHHEDAQQSKKTFDLTRGGGMTFDSLLPYLEKADHNGNLFFDPNRIFTSSLDPSFVYSDPRIGPKPRGVPESDEDRDQLNRPRGNSSYAVNSILVEECMTLRDVSDGTTNTILFSERYANCEDFAVIWSLKSMECRHNEVRVPCPKQNRRSTFSDRQTPDDHPVRDSVTGRTVGTSGNRLFQIRPTPSECDMNRIQSLTSYGLGVALADGSVRVLKPGMEPSIFWSAVTPRGNDSVNFD